MAVDFSKFNFFNRLDARSRVFVLLGVVVGVIVLIYFGTRYFFTGDNTTGPSSVANAPQGLQSIPGGSLTPEYQRAVQQANTQSAQQAQITGGSAVPTMINTGSQPTLGASCIICSDQSANVKNYLDDWTRQGKITPEVAQALQQLADRNVGIEDYAAALDQAVKEGKLTPDQARALLEQYQKQHTNNLLADSAHTMDDLIKSGKLPLDVANQLLDAQKRNVSPAEYAAMLQELVRQGKISPEVAQQLLAQYTQQRAKEVVMKSIASLRQMARSGQITPDVERDLIDLENRMVPVSTYDSVLQKYIAAGKMTPAVAAKILDEFKSQKAAIGPTASVNQLLQKAEADAFAEINDLVKTGKMPADTGALLASLIQQNPSLDQYRATLDQLVQQKKITPDIAKLKFADYEKIKGLRDLSQQLAALQGNNASPQMYADKLKQGVATGLLTPDEAAQLMQEYQAMTAPGVPTTLATGPGSAALADLQKRVATTTTTGVATPEQFEVAQTAVAAETAQDRQARIDAMMTAMAGQAQQLISAWQPVAMNHTQGSPATTATGKAGSEAGTGSSTSAGSTTTTTTTTETAPIIKAGSILFAVLDTAVNSDYPASPVLATIVAGKFKGAKLLGKLNTTKSVSGQLDRVSLNFTVMNMDDWSKSKTITAYAIDPDTARTVLASSVNYHYLQRFGAIMATSFLQGYASAITSSSSTTTTGIFGTSTTHPELSPSQKLAVGLGQVGQTLGAVTQNYVNIPPTVRVDSGVGLGILFMSDVS